MPLVGHWQRHLWKSSSEDRLAPGGSDPVTVKVSSVNHARVPTRGIPNIPHNIASLLTNSRLRRLLLPFLRDPFVTNAHSCLDKQDFPPADE